MKDYRIDGPDEARQIVRDHPQCQTAPQGTGARCTCNFDCGNYWLRAKGFKAVPTPVKPETLGQRLARTVRRIMRKS